MTIYILLTSLKTSGFTATSTRVEGAFSSLADAEKAKKILEKKLIQDPYVGIPFIKEVELQ